MKRFYLFVLYYCNHLLRPIRSILNTINTFGNAFCDTVVCVNFNKKLSCDSTIAYDSCFLILLLQLIFDACLYDFNEMNCTYYAFVFDTTYLSKLKSLLVELINESGIN